jgi:hypothetical protein
MGKQCTICKELKSPSEFYKHSEGQLMGRCKACDREYKRNRYHSNAEYRDKVSKDTKERRLQKTFGISTDEYDALMKEAKCSICESTTNLVLDHCHNSGKIRGVLCRTCNTGIGHLKDSPELVARALYYLQDSL